MVCLHSTYLFRSQSGQHSILPLSSNYRAISVFHLSNSISFSVLRYFSFVSKTWSGYNTVNIMIIIRYQIVSHFVQLYFACSWLSVFLKAYISFHVVNFPRCEFTIALDSNLVSVELYAELINRSIEIVHGFDFLNCRILNPF